MSASAVRAGRAFVEIGARDKTQKVLQQAERRLRRFGQFASGVGKQMAAVGLAATVGLAAVTGILAGFDKNMAEVAAKTGATEVQLRELRDTAKELGATTRFSASEAAAGMGYLAQAGFNTDQILAAIPKTLALAAAGGLELAQAADIASDVGSAFGLTADEIGRVADVIAVTASKTNTSVEMMGETFKFVAPIAKSAGQSIEEVSAAAGILGNSGIKASSAGTDLKNILIALSKDESAKKIRDLGVAITDANGEMRPMMDVLRDFGEATASMTGPQRLSKAIDIFGKISGKSALILSSAGNQVDTLREQMHSAEGSAEQMAETMQEGVHGGLTTLKSSAEGLAIEFGEALKPAIENVLAAGTRAIRWATAFVKENKWVAAAVVATVGAVTALGGALLVVGLMLSAVATVVSTVGAILGSALLVPALKIAAVVALVAGGLVAAAAGVVFLAKKAGIFEPIVKGVMGTLREFVSVAWKTIRGVAKALMSGDVTTAAKILWAGVKLAFWTGVQKAADAYMILPSLIAKATSRLTKWMVDTFSKTFRAIATGLAAMASGSVKGLGVALKQFRAARDGKGIEFKFQPKVEKEKAQAELDALLARLEAVDAEVSVSAETEPIDPLVGAAEEFGVAEQTAPEIPVVGTDVPDVEPPEATVTASPIPDVDQAADSIAFDFLQPDDPTLGLDEDTKRILDEFSGELGVPRGNLESLLGDLQPKLKDQLPKDVVADLRLSDDPRLAVDLADIEIAEQLRSKIDPQTPELLTQATQEGGATSGTTSAAAAALSAFTGDPATERVAKATEASAEYLRDIDQNLQDEELFGGTNIA